MKTLSIFVLLLTLVIAGLGYVAYEQNLEITDLDSQVSFLQAETTIQTAVIVSQQSAITKNKKRESEAEVLIFKIVDFLNHLDIETEPSSGNGPKS